MSRLFVALATLCCLLALASSASAEEPKGFLEWRWGTPMDTLVEDDSWCRFQTKKVDQDKHTIACSSYRIGDIQVQQLTLYFQPSNALTGYAIVVNSGLFGALRATAIEKFGPPTSTKTNQFRNSSGTLIPGEELEWQWPSGTTAGISDLPLPPLTISIFTVSSKELGDLRQKEEEQKKQERRKGF